MPVTILIDDETARLAKRVAEAKGTKLSEVVREAIEGSARAAGVDLRSEGLRNFEDRRARMQSIADRSAARPVLDQRTAEEIIGYDDRGLLP